MKLRLASDVHTEFFNVDEFPDIVDLILPPLMGDKEMTLVLAGDIGSMRHPECLVAFIDESAPRFADVLYIPGNHEYYGGNLTSSEEDIANLIKHHENVFFAQNGRSIIGGRRVLQTTLWTDFDGADPLTMREAQERMNDYRLIQCGNRSAQPHDTLERHRLYLESLTYDMKEGDIVISHHMPSHKSVPGAYKDQGRINGAYASNLEALILEKKPKLWMHGHTHDACDYTVGDTRILCNPRGYGNQYKKNGYNPFLVVEL